LKKAKDMDWMDLLWIIVLAIISSKVLWLMMDLFVDLALDLLVWCTT